MGRPSGEGCDCQGAGHRGPQAGAPEGHQPPQGERASCRALDCPAAQRAHLSGRMARSTQPFWLQCNLTPRLRQALPGQGGHQRRNPILLLHEGSLTPQRQDALLAAACCPGRTSGKLKACGCRPASRLSQRTISAWGAASIAQASETTLIP